MSALDDLLLEVRTRNLAGLGDSRSFAARYEAADGPSMAVGDEWDEIGTSDTYIRAAGPGDALACRFATAQRTRACTEVIAVFKSEPMTSAPRGPRLRRSWSLCERHALEAISTGLRLSRTTSLQNADAQARQQVLDLHREDYLRIKAEIEQQNRERILEQVPERFRSIFAGGAA